MSTKNGLTLLWQRCSVTRSPHDVEATAKMTAKKPVNLEKALADLETLVDELESGDLPLEKAMQKFEEGIKLTRSCQTALKEAEQKVEILLKSAGGEESLEAFEPDDQA